MAEGLGTIEKPVTTVQRWQQQRQGKDPYYHPKIHYVTEGHRSSQTARQYLFQFNNFLRFLGFSVSKSTTTKEEYDRYLAKLLEMHPVQIEEHIAEYLEHLKDKKHQKSSSIHNIIEDYRGR